MSTVAGTVAALVRYPVRSMLGEPLSTSHVDAGGLFGDGAFEVVDVASGESLPGTWSGLLGFRATYTAEPEPGAPLPPVDLRLQDGSTLRSDDEKVHIALSELLGREVHLTAVAPSSAPVHLITTSTLDTLAGLAPGTGIDARRFRPHLLLEVPSAGFVEDDWVGRTIALGEGGEVGVGVSAPAPCGALCTLAQDGLPADAGVLDAVARHHGLELPGLGVQACVGVLGEAAGAGTVSVGDRVDVRG